MKSRFATCVVFPFILSLLFSVSYFSVSSGKPVTGFVVGIVFGFIMMVLTGIIEKEMIEDELPYNASEKLTYLHMVPYYFFYIWLRFVAVILKGYLAIVFVLGAIWGVISLLGLLSR